MLIRLITISDMKNRGEQTASALENHLNALEGKMDELLAFFEGQDASKQETNDPVPSNSKTQEKQVKPEEPSR
jgi:hypothetical protein